LNSLPFSSLKNCATDVIATTEAGEAERIDAASSVLSDATDPPPTSIPMEEAWLLRSLSESMEGVWNKEW
jgi:hypothetical protein